MTMRERIMQGKLFTDMCEGMPQERLRAKKLMKRFNDSEPDDVPGRRALLEEIFGGPCDAWIEPPVYFCYGSHISLGKGCYVNVNCSFMQEHCTERITLSTVADNVYVSQWHLSKLINRHAGQSFLDLLGGMRIERAKVLLKDPSMRVHEVAERAGFSDVAHFSKSFKKLVGKTPGEYRAGLK